MIDPEEILPILLNVQRIDDSIEIRIDTSIIEINNDKRISHYHFLSCSNIEEIYNDLSNSVGKVFEIEINEENKSANVIIDYGSLELDINFQEINHQLEDIQKSDLKIINNILSERYITYRKYYDELYTQNENLLIKIEKYINHELDNLNRKEQFFQTSNLEKAEIAKENIKIYKKILELLGK